MAADETEVKLVHDRVGFEGVVLAFAPQEARRERAQLRLDDREQLVARVLVAGTPTAEPTSNLRRFGNLCHKSPRRMILTPSAVRYTE